MRTAVLRSFNSRYDPRTQAIKSACQKLDFECLIFDWSGEEPPAGIVRFCSKRVFGAGIKHFFSYLKFNLWIYRSLFHWQPQVVVCIDTETFIGTFPYKILSKIKKRNVIIVLDLADPLASKITNKYLKRIISFFEKCASIGADRIVFPSETRLPEKQNSKYRVVGNNFIDPYSSSKLKNLPKAENSIFYGGLLLKDRGIELLLELASRLNQKITIAGYGEQEEWVKTMAASHPNVTFFGKVEFDTLSRLRAHSRLSWCWYDQDKPENRDHASGKILESLLVGSVPVTNVSKESLPSWYFDLKTDIIFVDATNYQQKISEFNYGNYDLLDQSHLETTQSGYLKVLEQLNV